MPDYEYVAVQPVAGFSPGQVVTDPKVVEDSPHCVVRRVKGLGSPAPADKSA